MMLQAIRNDPKPNLFDRAKEVVMGDRQMFKAPTPRQRRAKAWLDAQIAQAVKTGPFTVNAKLYPELAQCLLDRNPANRRLNGWALQRMAADMKDGRWKLNGETIIVSLEGQLNDGQHRCTANIDANVEVMTTFYFGAERASRTTVDQGSAKTPANYLEMNGVENAKIIAHAARVIYLYDTFGKITRSPEFQPTKGQIIGLVDNYPAIFKSASLVKRKLGSASAGMLCGLHFIFARLDRPKADLFFEALYRGSGLSDTDPVFVLRERLMSYARDGKDMENRISELVIRAWNAYRARKTLTKLQLGQTFPKAI